MIKNRDYTLILDMSGSMATPDQSGGVSRWQAAQESTLALARKCEQLDPDGITVYVFSTRFQRYDSVTSAKVAEVFAQNNPGGLTNLVAPLQNAINGYLQRRSQPDYDKAGETILVITDGQPSDRQGVIDTIIKATQHLDRDEELGISFIQVGDDPQATHFLKTLDDDLQRIGAKFDICDTITMDDMADMSLAEVLLNAIED
ncbi:vWA domain-containing protein [Prochlorothrix hollandica]|uniref:von Willebrand factor A n=1 Tax=Prochlorothrix hollandica PCC 9006 = CALU 1027 TaxID=317619 RepID=A0A0M2PZP9_PROHO|nr:VWA domain-containing protein [Prochlorothrix hollandica]KKJ00179.1 von Willebrand factor A [Prochlorothrix hollandica PCC 9006 = CALU 1027]